MPFKATKLVLFSLLVLLVSCASKEKAIRSKQANLYFSVGTQSLMEQDYTNALTNLLKANELEPESSEILTNLAMAYYFKGQKDLAERNLQHALKINPANSDAKINLASMYFQNGKINDAEKLYKSVLNDLTYDKQARTYYNLGLIELEARKNPESAKNYLQLAIKEDVNYCAAHMKLGMIYFNHREFNQALTTFKDATLGTCYDSPAPHYYQALTLTELRRFDDAIMKYHEINEKFRTDVYAVKARTKLIELKETQLKYSTTESRAPRKVLESPEF